MLFIYGAETIIPSSTTISSHSRSTNTTFLLELNLLETWKTVGMGAAEVLGENVGGCVSNLDHAKPTENGPTGGTDSRRAGDHFI